MPRAAAQGTIVAVKKLLEHDARTVQKLRMEVKVLAKLRHPNLLLFMGFNPHPPIIVSEFMMRGSLHSYLQRRESEPLETQRLKVRRPPPLPPAPRALLGSDAHRGRGG